MAASIGSWNDVPAILRHCVVAVYYKTTGGGPDGLVKAFKICRDKLAKDGYLFHRGSNEILESIQLTGKGFERNNRHIREGFDGAAKDLKFKNLFEMLKPRLWEYDGPGGRRKPSGDRPAASGEAHNDELEKLTDSQETINNLRGPLYPLNKPPKK